MTIPTPREMVHTKFSNRHVNGKNRGYNANNPTNNMRELVTLMYYRMITELSCNRFEWKGLPDSVDERYLELQLFRSALVVFYDDREYGFLVQPSGGSSGVNYYDNPVSFQIAANGATAGDDGEIPYKEISARDCVPIWANMMRMPEYDVVRVYTEKLAKIDQIIDIATKNLQYSKVVSTSENQRQTWQNVLRQHDAGMPVIFGNKVGGTNGIDLADVAAFDIGGDPIALNTLLVAKTKIWSECMTFLGIDNANQEKKERLVESEVSANNQQVQSTRNIALNSRRYAAKQINKMFDLNITVDFRADEEIEADASEEKTEKKEVDNA